MNSFPEQFEQIKPCEFLQQKHASGCALACESGVVAPHFQ